MEVMGYTAYGNTDIILGIIACTISAALFVFPLPTFWNIVKEKSTGTLKAYPFIAFETAYFLWLLYSLPTKEARASFGFHNYSLVVISLAGLGFHIAYKHIFDYYTTKENHDIMVFGTTAQFVLIMAPIFKGSWYAAVTGPGRAKVFGPTAAIFGVVMYASPLPMIVDAWRDKRADYWLFNLCTLLSLNAAAWFVYGFCYNPTYDFYVAIANGCGIVLGVSQLALSIILILMYRDSGSIPTSDLRNPLLHASA